MSALLIFRLIHVVTGILWGGTVVFLVLFVFPAIREAGPAGGQVMSGMVRRKFMVWLPVTALLTVLSGLWLLWTVSNGDVMEYAHTRSGHVFTVAGGFAIIAWLIGFFVSRPAGVEAGKILAALEAGPEPAERERLAARLKVLNDRNFAMGKIIATLVMIAAIGMAVARYV